MKIPKHPSLVLGMLAALAATSANAAFSFNDGDLLLGVQATSGTGADKNLFFNLGSATAFRDNPMQGVVGNISTSLTSAFGADWYARPDVHFGVFGNLNFQPNTGIGSRPAVDGDPSRTVYASTPANFASAGQLVAAGTYSGNALGSMGNNYSQLKIGVRNLFAEIDGAAIMVQSDNPVEWNNSWSKWNPTPGAAFNVFTGGIQQNFGKDGFATYIDIQRIVSTNIDADPLGIVGGGQYIGSISIHRNGSIIVPEPSTALLVLGAAAVAFRRRRSA